VLAAIATDDVSRREHLQEMGIQCVGAATGPAQAEKVLLPFQVHQPIGRPAILRREHLKEMVRTTLGLTITELAQRAGMTADDIECIEEGGTEPTIPLLRRLAAALNADVRLTPGHDLGSVWFETDAA